MLTIADVIAGIVRLFAGRKFFWLFVAVSGFYAGFEIAPVEVFHDR